MSEMARSWRCVCHSKASEVGTKVSTELLVPTSTFHTSSIFSETSKSGVIFWNRASSLLLEMRPEVLYEASVDEGLAVVVVDVNEWS